MAFLILGLFSYALSEETKPFEKSTYEGLIRVHMAKDSARPEAIESWKRGCLETFQLNFQKFEFKIQVLDIERIEGYFIVTTRVEIIGLCLDKNNEKFRVISERDLAFLFMGNDIIQFKMISASENRIERGWEGTSI